MTNTGSLSESINITLSGSSSVFQIGDVASGCTVTNSWMLCGYSFGESVPVVAIAESPNEGTAASTAQVMVD